MGMCLEEFGTVSIEVRRESFIIHYGPVESEVLSEHYAKEPHPEFMLADLDSLIEALQDAKRYLEKGRRRTKP